MPVPKMARKSTSIGNVHEVMSTVGDLEQGLSQDWVPKIGKIVTFLGDQIFKGDHNLLWFLP